MLYNIWIFMVVCFAAYILIPQIKFKTTRVEFGLDKLYTSILFIFLVLLMTANRTGYDAVSYKRFYDWAYIKGINIGDYTYGLLYRIIEVFRNITTGITYYEFHAIVLVISMLLLILPVLNRYTKHISYVVLMYVASGVFASDGIQFKFFIAVSFLLAGINFLFQSDKKGIIFFYLLTTIAVLFHFSMSIFYFLPLIKTTWYKRISRSLPVIGFILYALMFGFSKPFSAILALLAAYIPILAKLSVYISQSAGIRSIYPVFIYCIILLWLEYTNKETSYLSERTQSFRIDVLYVWRYVGLFLPTLYVANASYRIYRALLILIFILACEIIMELNLKKIGKEFIINVIIVYFIVFVIFYYTIVLGFEYDVYMPILDNLFFWNM